MKQQRKGVLLAGVLTLAFGLSACAQWKEWRDGGSSSGSSGSGSSTSSGSSSGSGTSGSSGSSGSAGSSGSSGDAQSGSSGTSGSSGSSGSSGTSSSMGSVQDPSAAAMPSARPNATVAAIEVLPRPGSATGTEGGTGATGSSGSSGTTASSGGESSYRIMLRMDDGSTQVVTQDTPPTFRSGDRVSLAGGAIKQ
jgi:hypothetical protein